MAGRRGSDGFTLIEALVAFTVLAMVMVVIQRGVAVSFGGMARARAHFEAELVARTLLTGPLGTAGYGVRRGRLGAYDWTLALEPLSADIAMAQTPTPWVPARMIVTVTQAGKPAVLASVETVRLMKAGGP